MHRFPLNTIPEYKIAETPSYLLSTSNINIYNSFPQRNLTSNHYQNRKIKPTKSPKKIKDTHKALAFSRGKRGRVSGWTGRGEARNCWRSQRCGRAGRRWRIRIRAAAKEEGVTKCRRRWGRSEGWQEAEGTVTWLEYSDRRCWQWRVDGAWMSGHCWTMTPFFCLLLGFGS